eukprot:337796_1
MLHQTDPKKKMNAFPLVICSAFSAFSGYYFQYYYTQNTINKWNYNWDNRKDEYDSIEATKRINGKRSITLIRHSQYNRIEGANNDKKSLTELGKKQALFTGKRLNERDIKFDKIYCSKYIRAIETCHIIVSGLQYN